VVSRPATLSVAVPPLTITTSSLPNGSVYAKALKNAYSATLTASGGNPPYKWSLQSGSLPTGLKMTSKGVISGKASFAGTFTFTVGVVDTKTKTQQAAVDHHQLTRPSAGPALAVSFGVAPRQVTSLRVGAEPLPS
jgi:large repetitive protein